MDVLFQQYGLVESVDILSVLASVAVERYLGDYFSRASGIVPFYLSR